ncbi:MAG: glycine dehydrogenase (aminomethyl-transferring), partial [Dehalococcoidia bacterium]|nr:glycine dehydrogenase (aminomethyl-transferring) [Dehalococcoidia bacterium]
NFCILVRAFTYIRSLGKEGLRSASGNAVLNANYLLERLRGTYEVAYDRRCMHEFVLTGRRFKHQYGVRTLDIAKRLIDYGFHPPTVYFPLIVEEALMVEPTESESLEELDRFVEAMLAIREEIREVEQGRAPRGNNLLSHAPHPMQVVASDVWDRPYSRERAAFPTQATREHKSWPTVSRIDGAWGDRNLVCVCPPVEEYREA